MVPKPKDIVIIKVNENIYEQSELQGAVYIEPSLSCY
jgi:hypothetical protein